MIDIDKIEGMPVKQARMTSTLSGGGDTTLFTMTYDYEPKSAPLAFILGPILDRQMNKGFNAWIDYLESEAQARAAT